jgi:hypothetical protein
MSDHGILLMCGEVPRASLGDLHVVRSLPLGKVQGLDA